MLKCEQRIPLLLKGGAWQGPTNVEREEQRGNRWCWAACVAMVLNAFENPKTQCEIAEAFFNAPCCDKEQKPKPSFDHGYKIVDIGALWKEHGVSQVESGRGPVGWDVIEQELKPKENEGKPGRPIEIFLGIGDENSKDGHLVLIVGAEMTADGRRMVTIADPISTNSGLAATDFESLRADLRYGRWNRTWTKLFLEKGA